MFSLSIDRSELLRTVVSKALLEAGLSLESLSSLTCPIVSVPTLARWLHETGRIPLRKIRDLRPFCHRILHCELHHLLAFLRGSIQAGALELHERFLSQVISDDLEGVTFHREVMNQVTTKASRVTIIARIFPTFMYEEDQLIQLVKGQVKLFGLDPRRFIAPKLDFGAELHHRFVEGNWGSIREIVIVFPLSLLFRMRALRPPFQAWREADFHDFLDGLLHQLIHGTNLTLLPLDDLQDGADVGRAQLLDSVGAIAYFEPGWISKRLRHTFTRRFLKEDEHPAVRLAIQTVKDTVAIFDRRITPHEMRALMIEILCIFRHPTSTPVRGEPELLQRIRRLLGKASLT